MIVGSCSNESANPGVTPGPSPTTKKLTLVSIYIQGVRHSAFVMMEGNTITPQALHDIFPVLNSLRRGDTFSHG